MEGKKKITMGTVELVLIAIGLGMDAFTVSICKGISMPKMNWVKAIIIGLYFGVFQALMPVIGFTVGKAFEEFVTAVDHWIAFVLLLIIGIKMIIDAFKDENIRINDSIGWKVMTILAIATSIDALAVGITFAFLKVNLIFAVFIIGIITFILCIIGTKIGNAFGNKYEDKAEILGGIVLILIGTKILLEHLGII